MNKIIIFLLISFNCQSQIITHIGAVTYDRKIRKAESVYVKPDVVGGFNIHFNGNEPPSLNDLREVLNSYTQGQTIDIQKVPLAARTGQAFYISANSTNVVLQYTTPQSLDNAVYTYLDMLGVNWYGASPNWLVKKATLNVPIVAGQWKEPTFRQRTFDGTGGLDVPVGVDSTYEYKKNWYAFKRRNRFNSDFQPPSHVGYAFYIANRALCDSNPQWFNSASGKMYGRIRVEIPEAMNAYKNWYAAFPNVRDSFVGINADPEDGRGDVDDPMPPNGFNGIANWNVSDKWWYFANEIAKTVDSNNAKIRVAALSYGNGSIVTLIPKFPLKKNVYPVLTPYAYQTAYLPRQMIRVWKANTAGNMGIYDYWNLTLSSLGLPQFNIYDVPKLLTFWRQSNIDGVQLETTDAGGPMGHIFWVLGQMQFDTTKNFDTLYNKYLTDCFGNAKAPMKRMFDRWSLNYQNNQDVNFTLKDLKDATDSVIVNSLQWKRINDLKAYSHFMKIMAQRVSTRQSSNDSVMQYMYSIHQRMLVQTSGFIGQRYLGTAPTPISNHQLTESEIETNFSADLAVSPVEYTLSNMVFNYNNATYIDSIPIGAWKYGLFTTAQFKAKVTGTVSIDMGSQYGGRVKIFTDDSTYTDEVITPTNFAFNEVIGSESWYMKNYTFNAVQGQTYYLATKPGGFGRMRMRTNGIIVFFQNSASDFDNAGYPLKYFYVPIGTTKIAYTDGELQGTGSGLIPPNGTALTRNPTSAKDVYTVNVPTGKDGQVWTARFGSSSWSFNNIPNISTLQKFSYTE